jgi:hypothetical protein
MRCAICGCCVVNPENRMRRSPTYTGNCRSISTFCTRGCARIAAMMLASSVASVPARAHDGVVTNTSARIVVSTQVASVRRKLPISNVTLINMLTATASAATANDDVVRRTPRLRMPSDGPSPRTRVRAHSARTTSGVKEGSASITTSPSTKPPGRQPRPQSANHAPPTANSAIPSSATRGAQRLARSCSVNARSNANVSRRLRSSPGMSAPASAPPTPTTAASAHKYGGISRRSISLRR